MVQIQNSDAIEAIRSDAGLSFTDPLPTNLDTSKVVAVMDMTPVVHQVIKVEQAASATSTSSSTLISTNSSRQTFIKAVALSYVKDATCDAANATFGIRATIGGVAKQILSVYNLTLTAQQGNFFIQFDKPILVDKNTTIQYFAPTYTAGSIGRTYAVYYYETN